MARIVVVLTVLAAGAAVAAAVFAHNSEAAPAATQIQRTFVSTAGSDSNPCTATEPCRTFQAALANTLEGGEVVALDSGGYGPFTVDKSVTVAGAPGEHVAITAFFFQTGITVNAEPTDRVVLRNLYLTGLGAETGILFQNGGSLHVDSVVAGGFALQGLLAEAANAGLFVRDSVFRHNDRGIDVNGSLSVEIADTRADRNGTGFQFRGGARGSVLRSEATRSTGYGFVLAQGAVFAISDSLVDGAGGGGAGVRVDDAGTEATLREVTLSNNSNGLMTAFGTAIARISGSTVTGNDIGLNRGEGTLETFGDNIVRGNTSNTSGIITTVAKT